jgi:hypothetical protein
LLVFAELLAYAIAHITYIQGQEGGVLTVLLALLNGFQYLLGSLAILKAILRVKTTNRAPYIKFIPASHLERASSRHELKGRTQELLSVSILFFQLIAVG